MRRFARLIAAALLITVASCGNAQDATLIPSLERLAGNGNAEALYYLGMVYHTGTGAPKDRTKALAAFRKAAAMGDPLAAYKLGCYYDGQGAGLVANDQAQALKYKLVAAEAGYALAQQDVGILYIDLGNAPAGLHWLEQSAAQGWSGGLATLATAYNGAPGVKPDAAKTAAYFRIEQQRTDASAEQREWLADFEKHLDADDRQRAAELVRNFRAAPTPLTIKALSGERGAIDLVASAH